MALIFVLLLLLGGDVAGQTEAASDPPVFRIGVSLVNVDAKVVGRDGKDISGLTAADFVIYDEDETRTITNFGKETTPVEIVMLLDVSPDMRPHLLDLTPRVSRALEPLRPKDRAAAILFGARTEVIQPLTPELVEVPRKVVNSIYKDRYGRGTLLNEALMETAQYLKSEPAEGRRSVIVVTTNRGVRATVSDQEAVRALLGADVVLNAILVGGAGPRTVLSFNDPSKTPPDVYRYAKETGGEVVTDDEPARALRRLISEATTRYSLQFPAPSDAAAGTFRKLRVELTSAARSKYPGAIIQARTGYEVPE
jgi:VWFA-related protein